MGLQPLETLLQVGLTDSFQALQSSEKLELVPNMREQQPVRLRTDNALRSYKMGLSQGCVDPGTTEDFVGGVVHWVVHQAESYTNLLYLGLGLCRYFLCDWDISLPHITVFII